MNWHLAFPSVPHIVPATFVLGLALGAIYRRFGNLYAVVAVHAAIGVLAFKMGLA